MRLQQHDSCVVVECQFRDHAIMCMGWVCWCCGRTPASRTTLWWLPQVGLGISTTGSLTKRLHAHHTWGMKLSQPQRLLLLRHSSTKRITRGRAPLTAWCAYLRNSSPTRRQPVPDSPCTVVMRSDVTASCSAPKISARHATCRPRGRARCLSEGGSKGRALNVCRTILTLKGA